MSEPTGRCFEWAFKHAALGEVVHGWVTDLFGHRFEHAWVERDGAVTDENLDGRWMPWERYCELLSAEPVDRYAEHEVLVYTLRTRHTGPWTREERGPRPRSPEEVARRRGGRGRVRR